MSRMCYTQILDVIRNAITANEQNCFPLGEESQKADTTKSLVQQPSYSKHYTIKHAEYYCAYIPRSRV